MILQSAPSTGRVFPPILSTCSTELLVFRAAVLQMAFIVFLANPLAGGREGGRVGSLQRRTLLFDRRHTTMSRGATYGLALDLCCAALHFLSCAAAEGRIAALLQAQHYVPCRVRPLCSRPEPQPALLQVERDTARRVRPLFSSEANWLCSSDVKFSHLSPAHISVISRHATPPKRKAKATTFNDHT